MVFSLLRNPQWLAAGTRPCGTKRRWIDRCPWLSSFRSLCQVLAYQPLTYCWGMPYSGRECKWLALPSRVEGSGATFFVLALTSALQRHPVQQRPRARAQRTWCGQLSDLESAARFCKMDLAHLPKRHKPYRPVSLPRNVPYMHALCCQAKYRRSRTGQTPLVLYACTFVPFQTLPYGGP